MKARILLFSLMIVTLAAVLPVFGQDKLTSEQVEARMKAHLGDFDYLLGDWTFASEHKEYGKANGFWSAVRMAAGAEVLDEYRLVDEKGETFYVSATIRGYNVVEDRWELISAESGHGLQNFGTAKKVGDEMHIVQKFGTSTWKIRYYNIKPDSFSWIADRSTDDGKTWVTGYLKIEARRIGPARSLGALAPARKPGGKTN